MRRMLRAFTGADPAAKLRKSMPVARISGTLRQMPLTDNTALAGALERNAHLWLADLRNGAVHQLTTGTGGELSPSVSSNGLQVAFASTALDYDLLEFPLGRGSVKAIASSNSQFNTRSASRTPLASRISG